MLAIEGYRKLVRGQPNLRDYLLGGPKVDDFEIERDHSPGREVDL